MNWLQEALLKGPILGDGAMGTMLIHAGLQLGTSAELWNVERPETVEGVHRQYLNAGARFVTTNTFGVNPLALVRHGLADRATELTTAGVRLARSASGDRANVLGSVGPFGGFLEPFGDTTLIELGQSLRVQMEALQLAGADGVIVETMVDPEETCLAVKVAKETADWPVLATFAFQTAGDKFRTLMGTTAAEGAAAALGAGADAIGANCGTGLSLDDYLELARRLVHSAHGAPVILQPNAGAPIESGGSFSYAATPQDLAHWAVEAIASGVSIIGGCCGTTPAHIKAMAEVIYA